MIAYILNLIDMIITLIVTSHGATELNPFANLLLMKNPALFASYKIGIVGLLLAFLKYFSSTNKIAKFGLNFCTIIYALLFLWHVINLIIVFFI